MMYFILYFTLLYLHISDFRRRLDFDVLIYSIRPQFLHENGYLWVGRATREIYVI